MSLRSTLFGLQTTTENLVEVTIPGVEEKAFIRPLSGAGRDKWELALAKGEGCPTAALVVDCLVTEDGKRVFTQAGDLTRVAQLPQDIVRAIADAVLENNNMGYDAIEDAEKN